MTVITRAENWYDAIATAIRPDRQSDQTLDLLDEWKNATPENPLVIRNCQFSYCTLHSATLETVVFEGCDFQYCDMENATFQNTTVRRCSILSCRLDNASFLGARVIDTRFYGNSMYAVNFNDACFDEVTFKDSYLQLCNFQDAKFNRRHTLFIQCALSSCDFTGADIRRINLKEALSVYSSSFKEAKYGDATYWPAPSIMLLANWRVCALSNELTQKLMAYDCSNHPDPEKFNAWAENDDHPCPYSSCRVARAAFFDESIELWENHLSRASYQKRPYDIFKSLLHECCTYDSQ